MFDNKHKHTYETTEYSDNITIAICTKTYCDHIVQVRSDLLAKNDLLDLSNEDGW